MTTTNTFNIFDTMAPIVCDVPLGIHQATILRFESIKYTNKEGTETMGCAIILSIDGMECKDFRSSLAALTVATQQMQSQLHIMAPTASAWATAALGKELTVYCAPQFDVKSGKTYDNVGYKAVTATTAPATPAEPVRKQRPVASTGK